MVSFLTPNKTVVTDGPRVVVDPDLPPGRHVFRLEVEDESGNRSLPQTIEVTIVGLRGEPQPAPLMAPQPAAAEPAPAPRRPRARAPARKRGGRKPPGGTR